MNERDKRRVGEQIEPGGRPKAPGRLELLQRFINTYNHDFPRGGIESVPRNGPRRGSGRSGSWRPRWPISEADAARLRELETIRARDRQHHGERPGAEATDVIREASSTALSSSVAVDEEGEPPSNRRVAASTVPWRRCSASSTSAAQR